MLPAPLPVTTATVPLKAVRVIRAAAIAKRLLRTIFILHLVIGVIADEMGLARLSALILSRIWKENVTQYFQNWRPLEAHHET